MTMPASLREFLSSLSVSQADELWLWLDRDPEALYTMIEILAVITSTEGHQHD